jgi:virginiamycin A acetyltransferase
VENEEMSSDGPSPETKHPISDVRFIMNVGGNPAAVLRYRFDPASIERLQKVQWWDWDPEKVTRNVKALCSADVDALERAV